MKYVYATTADEFGIVISNPNGGSISTIFHKPGCSAEFPWQTVPTSSDSPANIPQVTVPEASRLIANTLGLRGFNVVVVVNGMKKSFSEYQNFSEDDHAKIAELLMSYSESL